MKNLHSRNKLTYLCRAKSLAIELLFEYTLNILEMLRREDKPLVVHKYDSMFKSHENLTFPDFNWNTFFTIIICCPKKGNSRARQYFPFFYTFNNKGDHQCPYIYKFGWLRQSLSQPFSGNTLFWISFFQSDDSDTTISNPFIFENIKIYKHRIPFSFVYFLIFGRRFFSCCKSYICINTHTKVFSFCQIV